MSILSNEQDRLKALLNYKILDTLPEKEFDRLTTLASAICETNVSLICLLDDHRQWFKSKTGIDISETPKELAFCSYTILGNELMEVEDASKDERFKYNPLVVSDPQIRFYAGYPLIDQLGNALGTICVIDTVPKKLNAHQKQALKLLADFAIELIQERRNSQEFKYFNKLFKLTNDLICVAGTDGFFKKVNPAFNELLGWDESYLLKISFLDLTHPDDVVKTKLEIDQLEKGIVAVSFINRLRCNDGTYKYIQWATAPEVSTGYLFSIGRDLTLEKQKEILLTNSEHKLRSFFENSQGFMCTHDVAGNFLTVNSSGAESLGYLPEEMTKMSLFDVVPASHHQELERYLALILEKGIAKGIMHTKNKNGSLMIWLFSNVVEEDADGNKYIIGNSIDITERHRLEADLKWTKEMMEHTNEAARIGSWNINLQSNKIYWSDMTKSIHGVSLDYVPTYETAISFFEGTSIDLINCAVEKAINKGIAYDLELKIKTANGELLWVRTIGTPEFKDGVCKRLYGTFQDINDKKKVEEALLNQKSRLRAFVDHAPAAVAMFDTDMKYIAVSKRWIEDYHLKDKEIIGVSHFEVFPHITDEWKAVFARCLKGDIEKDDEYLRKVEGADDQYLQFEIRPWYKFDATVGGVMIFTQDITESIAHREELEKAKILAEDASIAKSEFLANMSHEIRTPLNGVIGFTDLVLKTNLNSTQHQYLSIVNQSANSLLLIINDILDFSKIEAGKLELDVDKTDLYEISSQAIDIISYQVQNKGLELLLNISVNLPRFIWVDAVRLKQVLVNLLGNAVKFTDKGEIELKITALDDPSANEINLRFEVRDTGIGIQEDKQSKIFEAFSQEDASTTKKYGGTGLGLTISNKLLGLMNSQLQLKSEPEQGSTFFFDLKLKTEHGLPMVWENINQIKKEAILSESESINIFKMLAQRLKVLVVEDNLVNKLLAKTIIQRIVPLAEIIEANDGLEAVRLFSALRPDIVFMDIQMPVMNGYEATQKIRALANGKHIPIIALTAANIKGEKEKCLAAGMDDFLSKPFVEDDIAALLVKWNNDLEDTTLISMENENNVEVDPHFDAEMVKEFVDNDKESLIEILNLVLKSIQDSLTMMEQQLANQDLAALNASGHKLFGTAAGTGMNVLSKIAREFEYLDHLEITQTNDLLERVTEEIKLVTFLINDFLQKLD
ncbi:PAS domain S-box protein [Pedobacter cryophilus]|uniref:Sensory/regulatory protein RpfC n=1 Tax=Pedobacter cryophilus TaxID=2571271 RepID=A0A4U1BYA8_9SPHI|nr:PAS domain S-box protein [Pedobacter cryophilus]TKB96369.1 PAS domain S-box protein [Pedobacter cryophilus]